MFPKWARLDNGRHRKSAEARFIGADILLALPERPPVILDRDLMARKVHDFYCKEKEAPTHEPDEDDYDRADEILDILGQDKR